MPRFELSIEQDDCTGCGVCPEYTPRHFFMGDDGLAYVKEDSVSDPDEPTFRGFTQKILVAAGLESSVVEAAEKCPGACIYVEEVGAVAQAS